MAETVQANVGVEGTGAGAPIVIDLGKKSYKAVKKLRKGKGKLLLSVQECIEELKNTGQISAAAQPVIVVVRESQRFQFPSLY